MFLHKLTTATLFLFLAINCSTAQNVLFVGKGSKLYFALESKHEFSDGFDYCHMYNLMPASIETQEDLSVVRNFLNSTSDLPAPRSFWLAATDHRVEGQFQWLWNLADVSIGNWSNGGLPPRNRSENCLVINADGLLEADSCSVRIPKHYNLCESPLLHSDSGTAAQKLPKVQKKTSEQQQLNREKTGTPVIIPSALTPIGSVGRKLYYVDTTVTRKYWLEALDYCHEMGMRLVSPETPEELEFVQNYAFEQASNGTVNPIYHVAGTDLLSTSCLRSNTEFRWFYSGNEIVGAGLGEHSYRYLILYMTPIGLRKSSFLNGGNPTTAPICETMEP